MYVAPGAGNWPEVGGPVRFGSDGLCLLVFSIAGPLLAVVGGGRLGLASTLDAGTLLAMAACAGPAAAATDLTRRDRGILVAAALTWLALDGRAIGFGLTLAGLAGLSRASRLLPRLTSLWLAIAVHVLWAPFVFRLIGRRVIAAELWVIAPVARALLPGVVIVGARLQAASGWYIYVLEGCSAFAGLSACALVWFATHRLLGIRPCGRDWVWLAVALCGIVGVNVARILLMLPSEHAYAFWHTGVGSSVVVTAGVALGAGPALLRGRRV